MADRCEPRDADREPGVPSLDCGREELVDGRRLSLKGFSPAREEGLDILDILSGFSAGWQDLAQACYGLRRAERSSSCAADVAFVNPGREK